MRARILDQQVKLYSSPEPNALSLATLAEGTEIEFGKTIKAGGKKWIEVLMSTGQKGYIPGDTRVYPLRLATTLQNNVQVYNQPTAHSLVRLTLKRNTKIYLVGVTRTQDMDWAKVCDLNGVEGYISGQTRLRIIPEKSRALARKNIISGALWCGAGLLITGIGATPSGSGTYIVAWGAILYGGIQLITGIYQFFTATS